MSRYRPPQRTVLSAVLEAPTDNDADGDLAGIGLGLPMAKQIVDMMHGSISLSRVENSSTVLAFTIPSTCVSSLITTASRRYRLEHDVSVNSDSSSVRGGAVSSSVLDALRATVTSSPRVTQLSGQGNVAVSVESFDEKPQSRDNQYRGNTLSAGDVVVPVDAANAAVPDIGLSPICNPSSRRENVIERVCNPVSISEEPDGVPGENFTHDPILSGHSREGGASPGATAVIPSGFSSVGIDTIPISRESPDAAVGGVVSAAGLAANKGQATPKLQPLILPLSSSILQPGQELAGMRVLVVDDERAIRRLCQRMLERLGCTCVLLEDGDQVMDTLLASGYVPKDGAEPTGHIATPFQPFHAVLMDIMMVRSNGVDVVVEVRSRFENTPAPTPSPTRARAGSAEAFSPAVPSQCRLPPFIAMTANTSLADITNYKRAGFVNVLGKPFDLSALRTKLLVYRQIV
jgi:CheY-like chemotaxis protein